VVDDRDDMVEKALSWALRSLAPRDPREVARFVARHNDELSARVRREVGTKLRTGRKVERRRTGVAT
jgi:3-methyladenine DNA glycosylase AlkD